VSENKVNVETPEKGNLKTLRDGAEPEVRCAGRRGRDWEVPPADRSEVEGRHYQLVTVG